jgi:hypothetical protein
MLNFDRKILLKNRTILHYALIYVIKLNPSFGVVKLFFLCVFASLREIVIGQEINS